MMAIRTEHAGAKNGGGYWGKRAEAKRRCRRLRRKEDRKSIRLGKCVIDIVLFDEVKLLEQFEQVSAKSVESKIISTVTQIMMSTDREAVKAKILAPGVPVYEADPAHPGKVIRIMPDGTRASGRVKDGVFAPSPVRAAR